MKIELFGTEIALYGILFFFGIGVAVILGMCLIKKREIPLFDFACAAVYAMIGAIVGAKLLFIIVSWQEIVALQLSFEAILKGGFVFYGGLIGGALGLFIYGKQFKIDMKDYIDVCATVLPLGHAFGRLGCFCAGCCYGIPYDGIGSFVYTEPTNAFTPVGVPLLPIQLIEALCLLILFEVLLLIFDKSKQKGLPALVYMIAYAVLRFVLEFFRGDIERGVLLGLSASQWISIGLLAIAFVVLWRKKILKKRNE